MRRSKILFSAVAIAAGLLIGLANPKEAKAADLSGSVNTSDLDSNTDYNITGDVTLTINSDYSSSKKITFAENSKLTIRDGGGTYTITGNGGFNGQGKGDIVIDGGNIVLNGGGSRTSLVGGVKSITINSGSIRSQNGGLQSRKLVVSGGTLNIDASGIQNNGLDIEGPIEISGGKVEVRHSGNYNAINGNSVSITGGEVKAYGKTGINCSSLSVSDDADVYAEGTQSGSYSGYGVRSTSTIAFTGGKLEAKGYGSKPAVVATSNIVFDQTNLAEPSGGERGRQPIMEGSTIVNYWTIKSSTSAASGANHVIFRTSPVTTKYQITVQADHGTASADRNEAEEGATINLSATPDDGYEFDKWTSGTQGVSFDDASSANTSFEMPARNVTVSANFIKKGSDPGDDKKDDKKDKKKDSGKHHKHKHSDDSSSDFVANPDAIVAFYIVNGAVDGKAKLGKQEQGPVCKSLFTASCPKGWIEAFSMSMSYDGVYTSTLKNGTLQLYIPAQYQKAGRQYAVMAMDKYGKVHIYQDTDALPFVFTSPLNFEGYAFSVIYKD